MDVMPPASIVYIIRCNGSGANAYNSRDPSNGGKGIILNTKKPRLTWMNILNTTKASDPIEIPNTLNNTEARNARNKFVNGPTIPTMAAPYSSYFTLPGLNGTGFAIKKGCIRSNIRTIGNNTVV